MKFGGLIGPTYRPAPRDNLRALAVTAAFSLLAVGLVANDNRDCIDLVVWSSNEKAGLLQDIAATYNASTPTVDRRCATVTVRQVPSGDAEQTLGRAEPEIARRPDVWSPAAATWVLLLEQLREEHGLPRIVPAGYHNLMQSPLVIAMPQQMAETLRASGDPVGWRSILRLARDPKGWALYDKPWGPFRLGKTNPTISTSGLHALIGTYNAASYNTITGTSDPLTADNVGRPDLLTFVRGVESSVVHYGNDVATFLDNLLDADARGDALGYVSAVAVEEKQLLDYNRGNPRSRPCDPTCPRLPPTENLVSVYPTEGTLFADHPYVILNWADPDHREAALDFQTYLESDAVQRRFLDAGFRNRNGEAGPGCQLPYCDRLQPRSRVLLPDRAVLTKMLASWPALRKRANVLIAIDVGHSMAEVLAERNVTKLELAKRAATEALKLLEDDDEVGLWTFSTKIDEGRVYREVLPITPLGADRIGLERSIARLDVEGGTRQLYATVLAGVDQVRSRLRADRINALVVLSDGKDEGTQPGLTDLLSSLRKQPNDARVRVFTIAYASASTDPVRTSTDPLRQIAQASAGAFYDADPATFTIATVLRNVISNF